MPTKILNEVNRSAALAKSKQGDLYSPDNRALGKNRHQRRVHERPSTSTAEYNQLDMNKFFTDDILDVHIPVVGETNNYVVSISFSGVLKNIQDTLTSTDIEIDSKIIYRALIKAFNSNDVYYRCTCPDWHYRQGYWATRNGTIMGEPENRPSDETNPDDSKGGMCKHVAMVMSNLNWLIKVCNVIRNYINYVKEHYEKLYQTIIYPALYQKEYEEVQMDIDDVEGEESDLKSNPEDIDTSNKWARTRGQFEPGNEYRYKSSEDVPGQQSFDFDSEISD